MTNTDFTIINSLKGETIGTVYKVHGTDKDCWSYTAHDPQGKRYAGGLHTSFIDALATAKGICSPDGTI